MKNTLVKMVINSRLCLILVFIMTMSVLILASANDAYAADNEPKDLHWNQYYPYRAEWEWTAADTYPDKMDITIKYESMDGDIETFGYQDCIYESRNGVSYIEFNNSNDDYFFKNHGEGYYSFYLDVYYSGQSEPVRISSDPVHFRSVRYEVVILGADGNPYDKPWQVDRDVRFSIDQDEDAHYSIHPDTTTVLPAGKMVRVRTDVIQAGFKAAGFEFDPEPAELTVSDSGEKASFKLDRYTSIMVKIIQDARTVPVTIDFGAGHEDVAAATAEKIKVPGYSYDTPYDASVNGSIVTIPEWPQATKVKDLKDLISERIHEAWPKPGFIEVYDDSESFGGKYECFDGKIGRKSISAYSGEQEYLTEKESDRTADIPEDGLMLYVLWDKPLFEAAYTIEAPVCGTEITKLSDGSQSPAPVITPEDGCLMGIDENTGPFWFKDGSLFGGTIEGEETYTASFGVKAPFGYYFGPAPGGAKLTLRINGTEIPDYYGARFNSFAVQAVHIRESEWIETAAPTCTAEGIQILPCAGCGKAAESRTVAALGHDWGEWTVKEEATETKEGEAQRGCSRCGETETKVIPKTEPASEPAPSDGSEVPADQQMGKDGTAVGPGASAEAAEKAITSMKSDTDPKGTVFSKLRLKSTKQTKKSVKLSWSKVSKAKKYVIYGNKCGKANKPKKLATVTGSTKTFSKVAGKKIKKGTYYKFIMVALDKDNKVISTSRLIHVATKGGKVGNHKSVTVKKSVLKKARKLKKGKSLSLKAKAVAQSKKLKVKKHVKVRFESTNKKIATVSTKGVVKGKKKGTCYVYVYAQNGVYKKIKVVVK